MWLGGCAEEPSQEEKIDELTRRVEALEDALGSGEEPGEKVAALKALRNDKVKREQLRVLSYSPGSPPVSPEDAAFAASILEEWLQQLHYSPTLGDFPTVDPILREGMSRPGGVNEG